LRASKRLLKQGFIDQVKAGAKLEGREFSERLRSSEAREAFTAFLEKRPPNFTHTATPVAAE
jgi:enoyl-CoA hydratase/carnithine racemase